VRRVVAANPKAAVVVTRITRRVAVGRRRARDPAVVVRRPGDGPTAIVDIVTGVADPAGRLGTTFRSALEHTGPQFGKLPRRRYARWRRRRRLNGLPLVTEARDLPLRVRFPSGTVSR